MNNIYKQKAEKYKYKYLKLKQKYIAEGGKFSSSEKYIFNELFNLMPLLLDNEKKSETKEKIKSILAEITDAAFIESLSKALTVDFKIDSKFIDNSTISEIMKKNNKD